METKINTYRVITLQNALNLSCSGPIIRGSAYRGI